MLYALDAVIVVWQWAAGPSCMHMAGGVYLFVCVCVNCAVRVWLTVFDRSSRTVGLSTARTCTLTPPDEHPVLHPITNKASDRAMQAY